MVTLEESYYLPKERNPIHITKYMMYEAILAKEIGLNRDSFYDYFLHLTQTDALRTVPGGEIYVANHSNHIYQQVRYTLLMNFKEYAEKIITFCSDELDINSDAESNSIVESRKGRKCPFENCGYRGKNPKRHCLQTHKMDPKEYSKQNGNKKGSKTRPTKKCSLCGRHFRRLNQHLDSVHKDVKKGSAKYKEVLAKGRNAMLAKRRKERMASSKKIIINDCDDELASCTSLCTMDGKQTALLSVSVTFKSQENLQADNSFESEVSGKSSRKNKNAQTFQDEKPFCDGDGHEPPTVTGSKEQRKTENSTKNKIIKTEILPGCRGYSNNIYIQPIIVKTPKNPENGSSLKSKTSTLHNLRKQLRLRQASEWVTKHNQRIQLKGSLKTGVSSVNQGMTEECFFRCETSRATVSPAKDARAFQGKSKLDPQQNLCVKQANKLAKGFACRHWARDFLSKENDENRDDLQNDNSSLTIRSYVNVNVIQPLWKTTGSKYKKRECPNMDSRAGKIISNQHENPVENGDEKGHQVSRRSSLSSSISSNEAVTKDTHQEDTTDIILRNISVNVRNHHGDNSCTHRRNAHREVPQSTEEHFETQCGKEKAKARNIKTSQGRKDLRAIPLKKFPPIDPLRGSNISPVRENARKRKSPRRPHTVSAPFSFENIDRKNRTEIARISSSKSLGSYFYGIYGKSVK